MKWHFTDWSNFAKIGVVVKTYLWIVASKIIIIWIGHRCEERESSLFTLIWSWKTSKWRWYLNFKPQINRWYLKLQYMKHFCSADGGVQGGHIRPKLDGEWRLLDWKRIQSWSTQSPAWFLDILEGELFNLASWWNETNFFPPRRTSRPTLHPTMPRRRPAGTRSKASRAPDF